MKIGRLLAQLAVASLALGTARAATMTEGIVSHGALEWPEYVAETMGWFASDGVDLDMVVVGPGAAQQLAVGALDIAFSGFPDFVRAANQGAPLKIIINGCGEPPYAMFARPAIKTVADLKGKLISIGGPKDITLIYTLAFVAPSGLTKNDLSFVYAKATPDRFAALAGGAVDAAILYPPFTFRAAAAGFTDLGDISERLKHFPFTVGAVYNAWAASHRDLLLAYVKDYGRAVRWLYDPANKPRAVAMLLKYAPGDPTDAARTYDYFVTRLHAFSQDGLISPDRYAAMTAGLMSLGDLTEPAPPMQRFIDPSYVQAAWK